MPQNLPPAVDRLPLNETTTADSKIDHDASIDYWNNVPATSSGMLAMLGNFPWYTRIELRGSKSFLAKVRRLIPTLSDHQKFGLGVDCGAGVGRVTKGFLSDVCEVVDIVEPVEKFTRALKEGEFGQRGVVGDIYNVGLQDWSPRKKYDLIWTQWCVGHLTDAQLVAYVARCRDSLNLSGIMVVKENLSTDPLGNDMYDELDSSVTRMDSKFKEIFNAAGMDVVKSEMQTGFPKQYKLLPVKMYALRPKN
jgi:protein N-terminal methyltransferase